jgi:imidazolonepropionase-like amidohydrolase
MASVKKYRMKNKMLILINLLVAVQLFGQRIVVKNVNIIPINQNTVLKNKSVLIENGKIIKIDNFKKLNLNKTEKIINAKNKYLMPGLADMHVHLHEKKYLDTLLLLNISAGVTQIRVMNSDVNQTELKNSLNQNTKPTIHFSYMFSKKNSTNQIDSIFTNIKKNNLDFIKLLSVKDENTFDELMMRARQENKIVCGHYPSSVSMNKVLKSGFKSIEHLSTYPNDENIDNLEENIKLTREHKVYNCPTFDYFVTVFNYQYPNDYRNRLTYQKAPQSYKDKWEKDLKAKIEKNGEKKFLELGENSKAKFEKQKLVFKKLYDNKCLLLVGSDPSGLFQMSGFSMHDEMLFWSKLGIDNYDILKSATLIPAQFFDEQNKWGSVEVNKDADLIILSKNPLEDMRNLSTIETIIKQGSIYNQKELLKTLK